jgi:predicted RNase H-like nuclease (RuvC/YqgF family)
MPLKIVACQQIYSGLNPRGHRYTIFDIEASKPDGTLIQEKLRAFEALPIGETVDVTVTPFESEEHGRSFTLHRKGSNNATAHVNELKAVVEALQATVERLEKRVERLEQSPATAEQRSVW